MPLNLGQAILSILLVCILNAGCASGELSYPYLRTEGLRAACNEAAIKDTKTRHVAETVCASYLSAVIDSIEAKQYRVKVPSVCMPNPEELLEQRAEAEVAIDKNRDNTLEEKADAMVEIRKDLAELGGSLPILQDILILYRGYTMEGPVFGFSVSDHWRIALHRTPFETVTAALHEAWPCENYKKDIHGYHAIFGILDEYE